MTEHIREREVQPDPGALIESLRAFGYSLDAAVADLIDNSITAGARTIAVEFTWAGPDSTIVVRDDGSGMDESTLTEAMRLGTRSPVEERSPTDLGRFGLGLKTAAWSQARSLTVVTRTPTGPVLARRWDLDHVATTRRWSLLDGSTAIAKTNAERLAFSRAGTAVVLERLDRLVGSEPADDERARQRFLAATRTTSEHLGAVFHRYLTGRGAITISVNAQPVTAWDPFLEDHAATQRLPTEEFPLEGFRVVVSPFVLPHVSKLTTEQHERAGGLAGWNAQQGFYVYRAKRLLMGGSWLGIPKMQQEEHYKLARIRIDLDTALDAAWQIDVRKATARIPGTLLADLRRIARATRSRASEVYRFRGKIVARDTDRDSALRFVWQGMRHRGANSFKVNRQHPVIDRLMAGSVDAHRAVEQALRLVEENLPVEAIVIAEREHPDEVGRHPFLNHADELLSMLRDTHAAMVGAAADPNAALDALAVIEPFNAHPELVQVLREEIRG